VAQGTVLAPFNYNVASNGAIEIVIREPVVKIRNYADDAVFIITGTDSDAMNISLAGAMGRTIGWYKKNGFVFISPQISQIHGQYNEKNTLMEKKVICRTSEQLTETRSQKINKKC
jgi:hypothetical protein